MPKPRIVLLAEDDENQIVYIKYAFDYASVPSAVHAVTDGDKAIAYLQGEGIYSDRKAHPYPDLLLLDLKMPRVSGFEVLCWIKKHPDHQHLPVIVLTASREIRDVNQAYQSGAKSFLVKPVNMQEVRLLIREIDNVFLPPSHPQNGADNRL